MAPRNSLPKVLFLGHDSKRSGAPLVLLEVLRNLAPMGIIEPWVLLANRGDLTDAYEEVASVRVASLVEPKWQRGLRRAGASTLADRLGRARVAKAVGRYREADLVYANSFGSAQAVAALAPVAAPVVCHVHELDSAVERLTNTRQRDELIRVTSHFIAVSDAVRLMLVTRFGVSPEKVTVVYPTRPNRASPGPRRSLVIEGWTRPPDGTLLVAGCGSPLWTKGADLFVEAAGTIRRSFEGPPIRFSWLGLTPGTADHGRMLRAARAAGLGSSLELVPPTPDPTAFFARADLLLVPSREDTFSLVILEAAAAGTPAVGFAESGGPPELLSQGRGIIVSYLDVDAMAAAALDLLSSPVRRNELGRRAQQSALGRTGTDMARQVSDVLLRVLAEGR